MKDYKNSVSVKLLVVLEVGSKCEMVVYDFVSAFVDK